MSIHEGHRERMRKKYIKHGIEAFAPHEVLELMLYYAKPRGDTNPVAHSLIDKFGSVSNVFDADPADLKNVAEVGEQTVVLIKLIKDLASYYHRDKWGTRPKLRNFTETGLYALDMVGERSEEYFFLISLDHQHSVISFNEVEKGTVSRSAVSIRKVVECAVRCHASKVVLVHNHPSGSLTPSGSDIDVTLALQSALSPLDIAVIDHIIVAKGGYMSMVEKGYMR